VFNLSGSELIFLVLIALVVLGPDKLPEAMRRAGKLYNDFKKMTAGFQDEMRTVLDEPLRELRETADLVKNAAMYDPSLLAAPGTPTIGESTFHVPTARPRDEADARPALEVPTGVADETPETAETPEAAPVVDADHNGVAAPISEAVPPA
jgi:sec-independent protein translocase protein TatB